MPRSLGRFSSSICKVFKRYISQGKASETTVTSTDLFFSRALFDTERLIEKLKGGGFTTSQSEVVCDALLQLCNKSLEERDKIAANKAELASLRSELQILEKTDIYILKSDVQTLEKKMEMQWAEITTSMEHIENRVRTEFG
jgi:polyhydroxyalkanoate synthesis regulator phasin